MQNVKRTFFLTEEEAKKQREITRDSRITATLPHYELEDGTVVFGGRKMDTSQTPYYPPAGK